jgi:hypothetical protein
MNKRDRFFELIFDMEAESVAFEIKPEQHYMNACVICRELLLEPKLECEHGTKLKCDTCKMLTLFFCWPSKESFDDLEAITCIRYGEDNLKENMRLMIEAFKSLYGKSWYHICRIQQLSSRFKSFQLEM